MSFDETIIHGSAPALCGIKSACLFSMSSENYSAGMKPKDIAALFHLSKQRVNYWFSIVK